MDATDAMDVVITGGDTPLGRTVAEGFRDAGHRVVITGARRDELEVAAKELDAEAVVCDFADPAGLAGLADVATLFPHHIDAIVNVPAPASTAAHSDTLARTASAWHTALDLTLLSAVLTVQNIGDHLRSGGSIVNVVPESPREGSIEAAVKAALSQWTAGQAKHFGTRGIRVNAVATGLGIAPGYDGLGSTPPSAAAEVTRLALFLTTPAARHITGQTLHVSHGALAHFG